MELRKERMPRSEPPFLLGPGIRQRSSELWEGEVSWRGTVEQCRYDPGREEGKRRQQPDMSLRLSFPTGDHGETRRPAVRQIVHPLAGLGDGNQEGLAAARFDRRAMRGHVDDALNGGRHRVPPGDGDRLDGCNGRL